MELWKVYFRISKHGMKKVERAKHSGLCVQFRPLRSPWIRNSFEQASLTLSQSTNQMRIQIVILTDGPEAPSLVQTNTYPMQFLPSIFLTCTMGKFAIYHCRDPLGSNCVLWGYRFPTFIAKCNIVSQLAVRKLKLWRSWGLSKSIQSIVIEFKLLHLNSIILQSDTDLEYR